MISVIIPTFNRENTILASVRSVLNQTVDDLEVLIIDDGSTDRTKTVVEEITDPRVRYIYQENSGACAARNNGIRHAHGQYIAFHDSDDIWHLHKLEKQLKIMEEYDPDIVCCKLCYRNEDGTVEITPQHLREGFLKKGENLFGIGTVSLLAKRTIFEQLEFDPAFPRYQEMELLYRAFGRFSIYCIDEGMIDCARSTDSISVNPKKVYQACLLLGQKHPELTGKKSALSRKIAWNLLQSAKELRLEDRNTAVKAVNLANEFYQNPGFFLRGLLIKAGLYDHLRKLID